MLMELFILVSELIQVTVGPLRMFIVDHLCHS